MKRGHGPAIGKCLEDAPLIVPRFQWQLHTCDEVSIGAISDTTCRGSSGAIEVRWLDTSGANFAEIRARFKERTSDVITN